MCLETNQTIPNVATKDIIVYKMLEKDDSSCKFRSFHKLVPIKLGETYYSNFTFDSERNVLMGLHSYAKKKETIRDIKASLVSSGYIGLIVKCVIPKGSLYYTGTFSGCKCYASDSITYTLELIRKF